MSVLIKYPDHPRDLKWKDCLGVHNDYDLGTGSVCLSQYWLHEPRYHYVYKFPGSSVVRPRVEEWRQMRQGVPIFQKETVEEGINEWGDNPKSGVTWVEEEVLRKDLETWE